MRAERADPSAFEARALLAEHEADMARRYPDQPWAGVARGLDAFWLARAAPAGTALGCVGMKALDAERVEVKHLWVSASARGQGAALALMDALEAEAGARAVLLETGPEQREAPTLYARRGYRELPGRFPGDAVLDLSGAGGELIGTGRAGRAGRVSGAGPGEKGGGCEEGPR